MSSEIGRFLRRKRAFRTKLTRQGFAPGAIPSLTIPAGALEVVYPSAVLSLKAVVIRPEEPGRNTWPAVIFFHGGCHLSDFYIEHSLPFVEAGFAVMLPTRRGGNGNEGNFELFLGEVDDAESAVTWFSRQSYVDSDRIYLFGYSMGGEISAVLSLYENLPVRFGGSCGAFFAREDMFGPQSMFGCPAPFDISDAEEVELRTLAGNISEMNYRHYAFIGRDDNQFMTKMYKNISAENTKLTIIEIPGDHDTSLDFSVREFLTLMKNDC